ncbi:MAG: CDP-diacylglycerol--glycerol-3-phosphate 3-phosphatidyltransferase [Alphaproteobacteria bacterium]|nr:CDP-diacylglycerol--glycerol-3-phosphate 3-phosphatidyltransferase [Alphaproteobacteria bacterium]
MKTFVNSLTAFRFVAAFAIIPCFIYEFFGLAFVLFLLAAITDFFDGYLARKFKVATKLGGVMDHIADKFLIAITSILIAMLWPMWFISVPVILMLCRELYVSGLREFVGTQKKELPVGMGGKIKTFAQMTSLGGFLLLIYAAPLVQNAGLLYYAWMTCGILLWISFVLSVISAGIYTKSFLKKI